LTVAEVVVRLEQIGKETEFHRLWNYWNFDSWYCLWGCCGK